MLFVSTRPTSVGFGDPAADPLVDRVHTATHLARSIRLPSRGHVAGPLSSLPFHTRQVERSIFLLAPHTAGSRPPTASSSSPPARGRCAVPTLAAIGEVLAPVYTQEGPALQPAPPGRSVLAPPATPGVRIPAFPPELSTPPAAIPGPLVHCSRVTPSSSTLRGLVSRSCVHHLVSTTPSPGRPAVLLFP